MAEEEKKDLLGSETIDRIYSYLGDTTQSIYQRAQEDDPTSLTDEAARLGVGTAELVGNVAGAPVIKQTLQVLDLPFYLLRQGTGGVLEHGFGVDPRVGHLAVGTAEVFVGGKGLVRGATKGAKLARKGAFASRHAIQETIDASRAARLARKGKFWRSPDAGKMSPLDDAWKPGDITGPKKTYTQTAPRTAYPDAIPPDPWNPPDLQAHLFNYIDSTADVAPPVNPSVDDILRIQEELTGKRTEFLSQYTSRADIDMPQMMATGNTGQLSAFFPHEAIMSTRRGPANLGETVQLVADKSRKVKVRDFVKEDIDLTKYVTGYTQSGRTRTPTYDIDLFRDNIRDLIEADQIRASDIPVGQLSKVPGVTKKARKITGTTQVEELYGDYLAGYFNTYDTLDGAAVLKGAAGEVFPQITPALKRNLRLFKMNPEAFYSGHFGKTRTPEYNEKILELITSHKTTAEFLKGSKLQRHHLAVIDEIWPLFEGLRGNDVVRMRNMLKDVGIFLGNDPANLSLVPKKFHNAIIHDVLWKAWRPKWAGKTKTAKRLQQDLKSKRAVDRLPEVEEFKESMDIINRQIELGVRKFVADQGKINANNINDLKKYLQDLVEMDLEAFD